MRNMLLTSAAVSALLCSMPTRAQECTAAPNCLVLGYTKTAAQCSGKLSVRCPFDDTKYFCDTTVAKTCEEMGYKDTSCRGGTFIPCPTDIKKGICIEGSIQIGEVKYYYNDNPAPECTGANGWRFLTDQPRGYVITANSDYYLAQSGTEALLPKLSDFPGASNAKKVCIYTGLSGDQEGKNKACRKMFPPTCSGTNSSGNSLKGSTCYDIVDKGCEDEIIYYEKNELVYSAGDLGQRTDCQVFAGDIIKEMTYDLDCASASS